MDPERWNHLKALFQAALDLEPSERSELVATSCEGDLELQATLESLHTAGLNEAPYDPDGMTSREITKMVKEACSL